jgi:hypothetical protein
MAGCPPPPCSGDRVMPRSPISAYLAIRSKGNRPSGRSPRALPELLPLPHGAKGLQEHLLFVVQGKIHSLCSLFLLVIFRPILRSVR